MRTYAVIAAAGSSRRMGTGENKVFLRFNGKSVLELCIGQLIKSGCFGCIAIAVREDEMDDAREVLSHFPGTEFILTRGGDTRQASIRNALDLIPEDADVIAVHDAARCFVSPELVRRCVDTAKEKGSAVPVRISTDTVKQLGENEIVLKTLDRSHIGLAETPQVFEAGLLRRAYANAEKTGLIGTDDSSIVEALGTTPFIVETTEENLKITYKNDIKKGESMAGDKNSIRIGNGIDIHRFKEGRPLILGGVEIPFEAGLDGHSDADVLTHAVMDALLGAAGLPDIGVQFPDTDPAYKDISSLILLNKVTELIKEEGYRPLSIDATLILQSPRISSYVSDMKRNISAVTGCPVNIKATTPERLGHLGRNEGAEAHAVCLIEHL